MLMNIDWQILGFGDEGWGGVLLSAAAVTVTVSLCAWLLGAVLGSVLCWMQIAGSRWQQRLAASYITLFRGVLFRWATGGLDRRHRAGFAGPV